MYEKYSLMICRLSSKIIDTKSAGNKYKISKILVNLEFNLTAMWRAVRDSPSNISTPAPLDIKRSNTPRCIDHELEITLCRGCFRNNDCTNVLENLSREW